MNYRKFEAANIDVSLLGFGAMRLPTIGGDDSKINEELSISMIRHAIDNGVNYVDTAYVYHGQQSEVVVGKALQNGYREKVYLATKMPYWILDSPDKMEGILNEQLEKLGVDCIDFYLVHDISGDRWNTVKEWNIFDFLVTQRDAGKIRFIGFSTHGETPAYFKEVLDAYPWDFCQLQINYIDKDIQAGTEGYNYAVAKGVPIVVMEPLKGGKLTDIVLPPIQKYWDSLAANRSPAEWGLRWVANLPGVLTILSGMHSMAHVEENLRVLSDPSADAGCLTDEELQIIENAAAEYRKLIVFPCTACKYCLPCTVGINIPKVLDFRNSYALYSKTRRMQWEYGFFLNPAPSECIACGKCESACPQHLEITRAMTELVEVFENV